MPGRSQTARTSAAITPQENARFQSRAVNLLRAGCLEMHYQPILDLRSGLVGKVEALARLLDGDKVLPPAAFLPDFGPEELYELYVQGLDRALLDRNLWMGQGLVLDLSVNLPPSGLSDPRYFEATYRALLRHACLPSALTLEILEGNSIDCVDQAGEQFRKFTALGVRMAEDDLGSGHSSLTRLRELSFDWVKIDRSIVQLKGDDNADVLHFVHQLTRLSHALGKSVIVEGVENLALIDAIRILGADAAQGYGIARPMPAQQLMQWHHERSIAGSNQHAEADLTRLARLLLLEERLQACQEPLAASRRCDMLSTTPEREAASGASSQASDASCGACQLARFRAEVDAIYVGDRKRATEKDALLHAAAFHGVHSNAYRQARSRLAATA